MRRIPAFVAAVLLATVANAESTKLGFEDAGNGYFTFDTGAARGRLRADRAGQGLTEFVDVKTGKDLAHAGGIGLLSYYRLLSAGERWGTDFRAWPKSAKRLDDGAVEVTWAAAEDHPVEMTATYHWAAPDALDLDTVIRPTRDLAGAEVFVSSYFNPDTRARVYVQPPRHAEGKTAPHFLPFDATPYTVGTYLAFPRDLRAAEMLYDGRWERGQNPVQFSVNRFFAAPLVIKHDTASGSTALLMARPEECFSIEGSYDKDPPDGVAGHHSIYFSLLGQNLKAGQSAKARMRLVIGRDLSEERVKELYVEFCGE
jgi:hypothetical protein